MKKVLIVGAKRSGVYAALLAKDRGFEPFVTENAFGEDFNEFVKILDDYKIPYEIGKHSFDKISNFDFAVISPGVPLQSKIVKALKENDIPFIGEMEFAYRNAPGVRIVAITGTNGKSTTTALTGNIFRFSSLKTVTGGNLGTPFSELIFKNPHAKVAVLETSCFQLETIVDFHPEISVFLNFSEDHLNRYSTLDEYLHFKKRIFENQTADDFAVLNFDDRVVKDFEKDVKSKVFFFSLNEPVGRGVYVSNNRIIFTDQGKEEEIMPLSSVRLRGNHNIANTLAAVCSAKLAGLSNDIIKNGVEAFNGLEHRLEEVRRIDGVLYVNDSKATTPDSTIKALNSFSEKIVLIAGGSSKNNDFSELAKKLHSNVKKLVLIGDTAPDIANSAIDAGYTDIVFASSLKEAVFLAKKIAKPGDIVLLSPACASFDMFKNFEERGEKFKEIVNSI